MVETNVVLAALIAAAFGGAILLVITGLRGTEISQAKPPSRLTEFIERQRSPLLLLRVAGGVVVALLVGVVTHWPVAALGLGGMVVFWPVLTGGSREEQTQIARLEALVTWTEALRDTTAAHAGLEQAIPATAHTAPAVIQPALQRMVGHIRTRVPLEDALQDLSEQLDHAADMIIAALINNAKRRGDGLVQVLSGLAAASREELDMRRKITASRAADRRAVQLMIIVVIAVAAFMILFSGGVYTKPYTTFSGQIVLAIVLALFAGSFIWMRKLAGTRPPSRFLPHSGTRLDEDELKIVASLTGGDSPGTDVWVETDDLPAPTGGATWSS